MSRPIQISEAKNGFMVIQVQDYEVPFSEVVVFESLLALLRWLLRYFKKEEEDAG
jgi:hypothetical protein